MTGDGPSLHHAIFIVRLDRDVRGRISGVVERVRTGEKARVESLDGLGEVLIAMLAVENADPRFGPDAADGNES